MLPSDLTPEEEVIAFAPANPASYFGIQKQGLRGVELELVSPNCGVALVDLYFCAALQSVAGERVRVDSPEEIDNSLEAGIAFAWTIALEAVRQRPRPTPRRSATAAADSSRRQRSAAEARSMTLREQLRCLRDLLEVARGVPEDDRAVLVSLAHALAVEWDRADRAAASGIVAYNLKAEEAEHGSAPEPAGVPLHYVLTFKDGRELSGVSSSSSLRRWLEEVDAHAARESSAKT